MRIMLLQLLTKVDIQKMLKGLMNFEEKTLKEGIVSAKVVDLINPINKGANNEGHACHNLKVIKCLRQKRTQSFLASKCPQQTLYLCVSIIAHLQFLKATSSFLVLNDTNIMQKIMHN